MPSATALIWNIEEFGSLPSRKQGPIKFGTTDFLLTQNKVYLPFIAHVILAYKADICVIQEFRFMGYLLLDTLVACLGGDWSYDYIPGAVSVESPADVCSRLDYAYTGAGNSEGYAVVYKKDTLADVGGFTLQKKIDLVLLGKPVQLHNEQGVSLITIEDGAPDQAAEFPAGKGIPTITGYPNKDANILRFKTVRHPCYVNILKADKSTVPLVVYHAPVSAPGPLYATLASAASAPLWVASGTTTTPSIIAGDFNTSTQNELKRAPENFTLHGLDSQTGEFDRGDSSSIKKFGFDRSMVHYTKKGSPNTLASDDNIYGSPRDLLYAEQSLTVSEGTVIDIAGDLTDSNSDLAKVVFGDAEMSTQVVKISKLTDSPYGFSKVVCDADIGGEKMTDLIAAPFETANPDERAFSHAIAAAIFFRYLISDHLPLSITFDI